MTTEPVLDEELVDVHLLRYPVRLGMRASEHYEEVFREFALLAGAMPDATDAVPARMLALIDALGRRYARQQQHEIEREEALHRGETSRDMVIHVPPSAVEASRTLDGMLDETDEFCRDGALLTLAPAADVVAFRRWYLAECMAQIDGRPASPWPGALSWARGTWPRRSTSPRAVGRSGSRRPPCECCSSRTTRATPSWSASELRNQLHVVDDGVDAMAFLRQEREYADKPRPDLVLLDLNLPRMDGREVLESIKSDAELASIPVVVLTTSEAEDDVLRSYSLHANAYVTKPVDFERFIEVVRQIDDFFVTVVRLPRR